MKLVIDTSIVFSLFKSNSFTNKLLKEYKIELFAPKELIEELSKYSELICSKSKISKQTFLSYLNSFSEIIELKTPSQISLSKISKLISHKTDVPFLALALELEIPIWSNDQHFKKQSSVKVFNTEELKKFLDFSIKK